VVDRRSAGVALEVGSVSIVVEAVGSGPNSVSRGTSGGAGEKEVDEGTESASTAKCRLGEGGAEVRLADDGRVFAEDCGEKVAEFTAF
jgi:hypothetical protein